MERNLKEFEQRRGHIQTLIRDGYQSTGKLTNDLSSVRAELSSITVDTPLEDVIRLQQKESALALKNERGEAELKSLETEISNLRFFERQAKEREEYARLKEQQRIQSLKAQIADMDALLEGRKPWPPLPVTRGMIASDYQDAQKRREMELRRLRDKLLASIAPEAPETQTEVKETQAEVKA